MKKVLVVAAHPDDEVLGCGGTIARLTSEGCEVHVVIAAEGLTSRQTQRDKEALKAGFEELYASTKKANALLGVASVEFWGFPDNRMDSIDRLDITKKIEEKLSSFPAEDIYTHFGGDMNVDHRLLSEAVLTATRPIPGQKVQRVYFFEVTSSTEWNYSGQSSTYFIPNTFMNIEATLAKKMAALAVYEEEMREFPHARSMENLESMAKFRGASVGFRAAEAFLLARELVR